MESASHNSTIAVRRAHPLDTGRPVVWSSKNINITKENQRWLGNNEAGDNGYTNVSAASVGFNFVGRISAHRVYDATNGHMAYFSTYNLQGNCGGGGERLTCTGWGYCFSRGDNNAMTCDYVNEKKVMMTEGLGIRNAITGNPMIIYVSWHPTEKEKLLLRTNDQPDGSGTWSDGIPSNGHVYDAGCTPNHINRPSIVALTSGGYGAYFRNEKHCQVTGGDYRWYWTFMSTSDPTGMNYNSWGNEVVLFNQTSDGDQLFNGGIGIDGLGFPFVANGNGNNQIGIRTNPEPDGSGTWSAAYNISLIPGCTSANAAMRHIIMRDDTPGVLAYCQDGALYFLKADQPSAVGTWRAQRMLESGAYVGQESLGMSLEISGNGTPRISYLVSQNNGEYFQLWVLQSELEDSFGFPWII